MLSLKKLGVVGSKGRLRSLVHSVQIGILSLPIATRTIAMACFAVAAVQLLLLVALNLDIVPFLSLSLNSIILSRYQIWRVLSHAFVHGSTLHLVANMISVVPLGPKIEMQIGSMQFIVLVLQFAVLNGLLYIALVALGDAAGIWDMQNYGSAIGFSGVIFSMLVIFVYKFTYSETIRLYGVINAPTPVVPWLVFVIFMTVPRTSTLAHFCGLVVGYAYVGGLLEPFTLSDINLRRLEAVGGLTWMVRAIGYVPPPKTGVLPMQLPRGGVGGSSGSGGGSGGGNDPTTESLSLPEQHRFPGIGHRLARTYIAPEVPSDDGGGSGGGGSSGGGGGAYNDSKVDHAGSGGGVDGGVDSGDGAVSEADSAATFIEIRSLDGDDEALSELH